jgi:hypothetical protein
VKTFRSGNLTEYRYDKHWRVRLAFADGSARTCNVMADDEAQAVEHARVALAVREPQKDLLALTDAEATPLDKPRFLTLTEARSDRSRKKAQAAVDEALALARRLPDEQQLTTVRRVLAVVRKARNFARQVRTGKCLDTWDWDRDAALEVTGLADDTPDKIVADKVMETCG